MFQLTIQIGENQAEQVFEITSDHTTIGRHQDNSLRIKNDYLSAFHAEIVRDGDGAYQITDLDSFNGTYVNGLRIKQSAISVGDSLKLGFLEGRLSTPGEDPAAAAKATTEASASTATQPTVISLDKRGTGPDKPDTGISPKSITPKPKKQVKSIAPKNPVAARPMKSAARASRPEPGDSRPISPVAVAPVKPAVRNAKQQLDERLSEVEALSGKIADAEKLIADRDKEIQKLQKQLADSEKQQQKSATAEKTAATKKVTQLEKALTKAQAAQEKSGGAEKELRVEVKTLTAKLGDTEKSSDERDAELGKLRDEIALLEKARDEKTGEAEARGERISSLEGSVSDAETEADALRESATQLESKIADLESELDGRGSDVAQKIAELKKDVTRRDGVIDERNTLVSELEPSLATANETIDSLQNSEAGLRSEILALAAERDELATRIAELTVVHEDVAAAEACIADVRKQAARINQEIESCQTELERSHRTLADFETTAKTVRSDFEAQQKELRGKISSTSAELEFLTNKRDKTADEADRLIGKLRDEGETLKRQVTSRRSECEALADESRELISRVKAAERELEDLSQQREQSIQNVTVAGQGLAKVERKLVSRSKLLERLKTLRRRERAVQKLEKELTKGTGASQSTVMAAMNSASATESKVADLQKAISERQKEHDKLLKKSERVLRDAERKLDKKLQELRLADDRIRYSEQLDRDTRNRKRELADITAQFDAATDAVRHLQEDRENLATIIERMDQELKTRKNEPVVLPGQIAPQFLNGNGAGEDLSAQHQQPGKRGGMQTSNGSNSGSGSESGGYSSSNAHTESRLRELENQIGESENYLRIVRESLRLDDATVRVLTRQIIKRLDLIDDLIASYRHKDAGDIVQQLDQLRETFLDMLSEHLIEPYTFEPGTQLSLARRRRIKIVESRVEASPGSEVPRILETVRPGYLCPSPDDVDDVILRKAEVITANT